MLLRKADLLSLGYMAVYPGLIAWQWIYGVEWFLYLLMLLMSVGLAVVQHNHTHLRMWSSNPLNRATDLWLTVLQSTPSFVFFPIPTNPIGPFLESPSVPPQITVR